MKAIPSILTALKPLGRLGVILALLIGPAARAERQDWYVAGQVAPALLVLHDDAAGSAASSRPGFSAGVMGWYGLTNELHLGASLRYTGGGGQFAGYQQPLPDGSQLQGTLLTSEQEPTASALVRYRIATYKRWAPYLMAELGAGFGRTGNRSAALTSSTLAVPGSASRVVLAARGEVGVEYRFNRRFVMGLGLAAGADPGGMARAQFSVPLMVAWIL